MEESTPTPTDTQTTETQSPADVPEKGTSGSWGGLVGILLIVGLMIVGAFYSWGERIAHEPVPTTEQS